MSILNRRAKVRERARAARGRGNPWPCEYERASERQAEGAAPVDVPAVRAPRAPAKRRKAKRARR